MQRCTNFGVAVSFLSEVVLLRIFLSYVVQLKSLLGKEYNVYIYFFGEARNHFLCIGFMSKTKT